MNNTELVVADVKQNTVFNFVPEGQDGTEILFRANEYTQRNIKAYQSHIVNYPNNKEYWESCLKREYDTTWEIMTFEEYQKRQKENLLAAPMREITAEKFEEMLDILPPIKWCTINGVEMFCISEMYTGTYTDQYAHDKKTNKYYTKLVDCLDKSTWINKILYQN